MKVLPRNPAATVRRRTRTVAAIGAAVAAGTTGLMVLAVGTSRAMRARSAGSIVNPEIGG